ncbi:hypothetical protein [Bacillus benzoevorans]|uniref:Uncharacterized protein n=1 Tax=Bacillus benzoevorans TaxID=1456 RepID=A0A7X0HU95_9BACI|nr:hypothetical protein [Bacillus benzoevorans]MBB6446943.1 hypothetical protein [Bacillus benzoevorans]
MIRMTVAGIGGFVLVFIEAYIVIMLKGYETLDFGGISPFVGVWSMNFFLLFSIFTQIKPWVKEKMETEKKLSVK